MSYFSDLAIEKEEQAAAAKFNTMRELLKIPLLMAQKNASSMLAHVEKEHGFGGCCYTLDDIEQLIGCLIDKVEKMEL